LQATTCAQKLQLTRGEDVGCVRASSARRRTPTRSQQLEEELAARRKELEGQQAATKQERAQAEHQQRELDKLGATLKQVEAYTEEARTAMGRAAAKASGMPNLDWWLRRAGLRVGFGAWPVGPDRLGLG
jgi:beta-phosphoglucomutase-like phosphatase (HAD superfamily)